jgi:hypothetical protein
MGIRIKGKDVLLTGPAQCRGTDRRCGHESWGRQMGLPRACHQIHPPMEPSQRRLTASCPYSLRAFHILSIRLSTK